MDFYWKIYECFLFIDMKSFLTSRVWRGAFVKSRCYSALHRLFPVSICCSLCTVGSGTFTASTSNRWLSPCTLSAAGLCPTPPTSRHWQASVQASPSTQRSRTQRWPTALLAHKIKIDFFGFISFRNVLSNALLSPVCRDQNVCVCIRLHLFWHQWKTSRRSSARPLAKLPKSTTFCLSATVCLTISAGCWLPALTSTGSYWKPASSASTSPAGRKKG